MINYHISYNNAYRHFIDIKVELDLNDEKELEIQLPVWRPGRYELGNFIKNIQNFNVFNEKKLQRGTNRKNSKFKILGFLIIIKNMFLLNPIPGLAL